jgi:predicted DNA-binding transcriptional regulator AlpA
VSGSSRSRFITLQELCETLGISKGRYYTLQKRGIFPEPQRTSSNRPVFDQEQVQKCVEVVRSRVGINGEPILFNRKPAQEPSKKHPASVKGKHDDLIAALASLGLAATKEQVAAAVHSLPNNGGDMDEPALIKAVFLILKKQGQP